MKLAIFILTSLVVWCVLVPLYLAGGYYVAMPGNPLMARYDVIRDLKVNWCVYLILTIYLASMVQLWRWRRHCP